MKALKTLFAVALLAIGGSVSAQAVYTDADGNKYEFQKHMYLDLQGGAQYTLGEAKFGDLISPNIQVALGYQFSPVVGVRLQANAWQSMGGWNGFYVGNETPHTQTYKYKYVAPGLDLTFNLSNLIGGYNPLRVIDFTAFLGGGANIAFDNDEVNNIAKQMNPGQATAYNLEYLWDGSKIRPFGRGGLQIGIRLSDAVKLMIEGNANLLSDKYNSKKAENPDWYFNALAGLRINLGKTYNKVVPPAPVPVPEPIAEPEPEPQPVVEPAPVVEKIEPIRRDIFFLINKTNIRDTEAQKVKDIAEYLNKYPKAKVVVTGYADAGTGNDKINDRLAAQRADVVVKALKEQYGIAADRISYDSKGARVQPFAENDMNRVTICIAE